MENINDTSKANESLNIEDDGGMFSISEKAYEEFAFVSNVITTPVVCLFGIIGNSLSFGALFRDTKRLKMSIYYFLCGLNIFDIMYLIFGLLRSIPHIIGLYDEGYANYVEEHMKLGTIYVDLVLSHTSNAIIVLMSMERLLALVRPFTVKNSWLSKYPKPLMVVCFIINALFLLPYAIYFEVSSLKRDNSTVYFLHYDEEVASTMDMYMFIQAIVDYIIPAVVVLFINTAIPIVYYRAMSKRHTVLEMAIHGQNNNQTKITSTVFYITLMYFLLSLPNLFILSLQFVDSEYNFFGKNRLAFWLFITIGNLFSYINAANDFVIYVLVSNKSRKTFVEMYCQCFCCRTTQQDQFNGNINDDGNAKSSKVRGGSAIERSRF